MTRTEYLPRRRYHCEDPNGVAAATQSVRGTPSRNEVLYARRLERVIQTMISHLELPMTNEEMADIACLSPCHFNRVFRNITGIPPIQFYYALRLDRAKRLLVNTDRSITDICFEVGYNSLGTFISRFNELVGLSPNAFRRLAREFGSTPLSSFRSLLFRSAKPAALRNSIFGTIAKMPLFDGLIIAALFQRALPEGAPSACALMSGPGSYSLPIPNDGKWYILSVAIPWTASGFQLLTLDGLARGRSGPIHVKSGRWSDVNTIELALPRLLDPPCLAAIPILLNRVSVDEQAQAATTQARWMAPAIVAV
jgi:AraC-like DNA-binding protein